MSPRMRMAIGFLIGVALSLSGISIYEMITQKNKQVFKIDFDPNQGLIIEKK